MAVDGQIGQSFHCIDGDIRGRHFATLSLSAVSPRCHLEGLGRA